MTTRQASLLVEQRAVDVLFVVIKFNCPFMTGNHVVYADDNI